MMSPGTPSLPTLGYSGLSPLLPKAHGTKPILMCLEAANAFISYISPYFTVSVLNTEVKFSIYTFQTLKDWAISKRTMFFTLQAYEPGAELIL